MNLMQDKQFKKHIVENVQFFCHFNSPSNQFLEIVNLNKYHFEYFIDSTFQYLGKFEKDLEKLLFLQHQNSITLQQISHRIQMAEKLQNFHIVKKKVHLFFFKTTSQ